MRNFYKISCFSLVLAGSALAQGQGQTGAQAGTSAQSQTSVSADKSGAAASNKNSAATTAGTEQVSGSLAGGSEINAKLSRPVDAGKNKPGDEVTATAAEDIKSGGKVVIPKGSKLIGHVTEAQPRGSKGSSNNSGGAGNAASAGGSAAGSVVGSATNKGGSGAGSATGSATGAVDAAAGSATNASGSAAGNAASKLGIVFDRAVLKDGREVPLNATIQAVAAAGSNLSSSGMGGLDTDMSGAGSVAGSGRAAGGGLVGGVTGNAGGAVGAVGRTAGGVGGTVNSTVGGTAGAAANVTRSSGAVGGLNAAGRLTSGSKGVFGLKGLDIASSTAGSAQGSVITSATRNVRLDSGTSLLLVTGAQATGSAK